MGFIFELYSKFNLIWILSQDPIRNEENDKKKGGEEEEKGVGVTKERKMKMNPGKLYVCLVPSAHQNLNRE